MFHIHNSNRSECLLEMLVNVCGDVPADPFVPETIVVQNPGMARWLALGMAERNGVAANLEFPLLASFIWRIYTDQLDSVAELSPLDRETLLWRLMGLLPSLVKDDAFMPLQRYLNGKDESLRRYQLALRIADLFDQYLVFRMERVLAWEDGAEDHWQAKLWRLLCAGKRPRHRARLYAEFADRARADELQRGRLPARVSLFGFTAIPPAYLEVLRAVSVLIDVHLFILNPSLDYWGDIVDERTRARVRRQRSRYGRSGEADYLYVGNPLLASMGKQARDFIDQLHEGDGEQHEFYEAPSRLNLLGLLQLDVLLLQTRGDTPDEQPPAVLEVADCSVQVHAMHSRMREIQVLHDRLLNLFEILPGLTTRDIVVMAPDIDSYAPYIDAVFGAAPPERSIPWSIADRSVAAELPLASTLMLLLGLPQSRFAVSEILALLEDAAVMRRLEIDSAGLDRMRRWIRESNIRWGLDATMRAELGLPDEDMTTWVFGLRRLLLGYAMPGESEAPVDGIMPYVDIENGDAGVLGALADFIDRLSRWRKHLAQPRDAAGWVDTIGALLDDCFLPDESEAVFLQHVRETLADMYTDCEAAHFEAAIELTVVCDFLRSKMAHVYSGQAFLDGRVSFCNMVPMRSIPFRVVCLIGMNDGDFPRTQGVLGFDLMAQQPRQGDRSRREDDRYLFLEALLSAREIFYVSYIGRDIRSNTERVPSVLVSELIETVERGFRVCDTHDNQMPPNIITVHPLQPFSPRYFSGDDRLSSYAREWLRDPDQRGVGPFAPSELPKPQNQTQDLDLHELATFLKQPVKYLLEQRLGVDLREFDMHLEDTEAFSVDHLSAWKLKNQALMFALEGRDLGELCNRVLAEGGLPTAGFGMQAFDAVVRTVPAFAERLRAHDVQSARNTVELDLDLGGYRLRGWLHGIGTNGLLGYRVGKLRAQNRLHLWLQHLALNVLLPDDVEPISTFLSEEGSLRLGPVSNPKDHLRELIDLYRQGWCTPLQFFAESSFTYAERRLRRGEDAATARDAAAKIWIGNPHVPGERDDPYHRIAFRGLEPLDERFEALSMVVYQPLFDAERESVA